MIPKFNEIIHPVLNLICKNNYSRKEAAEKIIVEDYFNLTEEEKNSRVASGVLRIVDRVGWAFTYLTKGCL